MAKPQLKIVNVVHDGVQGATTVTVAKDFGYELLTVRVQQGRVLNLLAVTHHFDELRASTDVQLTPDERSLILREHMKHLRAELKSRRLSVQYWVERKECGIPNWAQIVSSEEQGVERAELFVEAAKHA